MRKASKQDEPWKHDKSTKKLPPVRTKWPGQSEKLWPDKVKTFKGLGKWNIFPLGIELLIYFLEKEWQGEKIVIVSLFDYLKKWDPTPQKLASVSHQTGSYFFFYSFKIIVSVSISELIKKIITKIRSQILGDVIL